MWERVPERVRRTNMRLPVLLLLGALLVGCGDADDEKATAREDPATPCATALAGPDAIEADLDGDGATDRAVFTGAGGQCPASVSATVGGEHLAVEVGDELEPGTFRAVRIPHRDGDLILLTLTHPRGGFHAHLYGYADGELAELEVDGKPIFSFVATDAPTEHVAAECTDDGFAIVEAVAHQPIGIAPAWDVFSTPYRVSGNEVSKGDRVEVADNMLPDDLEASYADLVANRLFENC